MDPSVSSDPPSPSSGPPSRPWEDGLSLPGRAFRVLAADLGRAGPSGRAALRESGRLAGEALFATLEGGAEASPEAFWEEVRRVAASAGLGRPEYSVLAPGIGSVALAGGPGSDTGGPGDGGRSRGSCHFAAGWIGGLLTRAAGEPVAVLEVSCAALGDGDACRFLLGSGGRLREVRRRLAEGTGLAGAVSGPRAPESRRS